MAKINPIMQSIREATPPEISRQVDLSVQIANRVYELMEKSNMTQKDLAKKLGKTETEVSRWLSGTHNLTLATIAKLSVALNDDIIVTPTKHIPVNPYDYDRREEQVLCVADDTKMTN